MSKHKNELQAEFDERERRYHLLATEMIYEGNSVQYWRNKAIAYKDRVGEGYENGYNAGLDDGKAERDRLREAFSVLVNAVDEYCNNDYPIHDGDRPLLEAYETYKSILALKED